MYDFQILHINYYRLKARYIDSYSAIYMLEYRCIYVKYEFGLKTQNILFVIFKFYILILFWSFVLDSLFLSSFYEK